MARVQTRRTISINRRVFERTAKHAEKIGRPMSQVVEDLLLAAIGDEAFKEEMLEHRRREGERTSRKPAAQPNPGLGRRSGQRPTCAACGEVGHQIGVDGMCSATYLAARLVTVDGWSVADAAAEHGVSRVGVYERLKVEASHVR